MLARGMRIRFESNPGFGVLPVAGFGTKGELVESVEGLPYDDLSDEERINLANQELTLARGREWLISAGHGFHEVPAILDCLRSVGAYETVKGGIGKWHIKQGQA